MKKRLVLKPLSGILFLAGGFFIAIGRLFDWIGDVLVRRAMKIKASTRVVEMPPS